MTCILGSNCFLRASTVIFENSFIIFGLIPTLLNLSYKCLKKEFLVYFTLGFLLLWLYISVGGGGGGIFSTKIIPKYVWGVNFGRKLPFKLNVFLVMCKKSNKLVSANIIGSLNVESCQLNLGGICMIHFNFSSFSLVGERQKPVKYHKNMISN